MKKTMSMSSLFALILIFTDLKVNAQSYHPTVGLQTYTLKKLTFEQVVAFAVKNKIKYLEMNGRHLNLDEPEQEIKRKKILLDDNALVCYALGGGFTHDSADNRRRFKVAKSMGIKVFITEQQDLKILDNIEKLAKEYDIKVAIHNHDIRDTSSMYGNARVLRNIIKYRDPHIGVCLDIGWITTSGYDAAEVFRGYEGRVYDIHLKDMKVTFNEKGIIITDVPIGTGVVNIKGLLKVLKEMKYNGVLAIEGENDSIDSAEFVRGAIRFVEENK